MRRSALYILPALLLTSAIGVTGCAAIPAYVADGGERGAVSVDTSLGSVVVPSEISRVVVVEGRRDLDIALSLGLPVVGYPTAAVDTPLSLPSPLASEIADAEAEFGARALFAREQINVEAIAAARPDLIISRVDDIEPVLAELQAIAPVLPIGEQTTSTWQEDLLLVAEATGRIERAEELIQAYSESVQSFVEMHADAISGTKIAPVSIDPEGSAIRPQRLLSTVLSDIGASPSRAFADALAAGSEGSEYGAEQLFAEFEDADALVALVNTEQDWDALQQNSLWAQLPAVQAGRIARSNNWTHEGGPITAGHILDLLRPLYAGG